jgi:hypothetical protein
MAARPLIRPGFWTGGRDDHRPVEQAVFLRARYRWTARRHGKQKEIVAVGRSILLMIIGDLIANPDTRSHELDADYDDRHVNTAGKRRHHIRQFEALGYTVTLEPAAVWATGACLS